MLWLFNTKDSGPAWHFPADINAYFTAIYSARLVCKHSRSSSDWARHRVWNSLAYEIRCTRHIVRSWSSGRHIQRLPRTINPHIISLLVSNHGSSKVPVNIICPIQVLATRLTRHPLRPRKRSRALPLLQSRHTTDR